MAFSYVLAENVGKIRAMIPDNTASTYLFEDEELEAFYAIEGSSLKRATALALETIASNEAMVLKVVKTLDISTDGAKVSDALLKRAERLREQAEDEELVAGDGFDIAEMVVDDFTYRERVYNQILRGGL